jgi:hypothetical protein
MQSEAATGVPRIQSSKYRTHLSASTFSQHESISSHPQGLRHELFNAHSPSSFNVGLLSLKSDDMRMGDLKLRDVLEHNNALSRWSLRKQLPQ